MLQTDIAAQLQELNLIEALPVNKETQDILYENYINDNTSHVFKTVDEAFAWLEED